MAIKPIKPGSGTTFSSALGGVQNLSGDPNLAVKTAKRPASDTVDVNAGMNFNPWGPGGAQAPGATRPVSADGLTYTDTGEPTPEYYARQQALDRSAALTTEARLGTSNPGAMNGYMSPEEWERRKGELQGDASLLGDLRAFAGAANNPIMNPVGWGAGKVGGALDRAVGTSVSGYIQDPVGQGLSDLGAPDLVQAVANPTGYMTRTAINAGTGYGTNLPAMAEGFGAGVRNLQNDAQNVMNGDIGLPSLGPLGDVFGDPAAGLDQYAQRAQALGAGARDALRPVTDQRNAQAQDMFATGNSAQGRQAAQTGYVNYGPAQTVGSTNAATVNYGAPQQIARTPNASVGDFGAQQSISAPTLAAAQQAAMGNFGGEQRVNAAQVGPTAFAQAQQAANQAGFLAGTAAGARDIADLDFALANESRAAMGDSLNRIRSFVDQGPGESQAQAQLRMAQEQNLGDALSLARSGRGNAAGNMKMALSENAATNAQTNLQAALLRANEADLWRGRQLQGLGLEQQGTSTMRGQDIGMAQAQGQHALGREQIASNVDVSRAGLEQQLAMTNAQLGTQANLQNAEQQNLGTRLQAQLSTDAALQQASLANARNIAMGQAGTQVSMSNAEQANLTSRLQGQLQSDAAIQQAGLANARNIAMGQAGTQTSMANADRLAANARAQAELANSLAIAQGNSSTEVGLANAQNASAAQRAQAELANALAIAQGNSSTNINQANLEAQIRQREANDALMREMYGYGLESQQMGQDALTYGLGLERDYSGQASELAAEMAKARALRNAALIGGGASLIEEIIPG